MISLNWHCQELFIVIKKEQKKQHSICDENTIETAICLLTWWYFHALT